MLRKLPAIGSRVHVDWYVRRIEGHLDQMLYPGCVALNKPIYDYKYWPIARLGRIRRKRQPWWPS